MTRRTVDDVTGTLCDVTGGAPASTTGAVCGFVLSHATAAHDMEIVQAHLTHRGEMKTIDARDNVPPVRRAILVVALFAVFAFPRAAHAQSGGLDAVFGLSFSIARQTASDARIVDEGWVDAQINEANRLFSPLGTRFRWTIEKPLAETHASMHTRADRDALTPLTEANGVVDVFLVRELEDVDDPGTYRRGVCWTGKGGKRFLIVSQVAGISVLAHELGHFFGNQHTQVTDNLMSYSRTGAPPFLDDGQKATITAFSTRFLATGRLVDVGPPIRFF